MRVGVGDGSGPMTHPPIARLLPIPTLDEIYALTRDLSIYDDQRPDGVAPVGSPEAYAPAEGKGYLIEIRARGEQRAWALPRSDTSAHALIRRLATLSWIKE